MACACKTKHQIDELNRQVRRNNFKHVKKTWQDYLDDLEFLCLQILDKLIKCVVIIVASPLIILFTLISVLFSGKVVIKVPHKYFKQVTANVSKELQN